MSDKPYIIIPNPNEDGMLGSSGQGHGYRWICWGCGGVDHRCYDPFIWIQWGSGNSARCLTCFDSGRLGDHDRYRKAHPRVEI
jgi:hypothetical protein